jgi:putative addiction module component (TIGR02574 family)
MTEILELPVDERIRLVELIWESIAAVPEAVPVSEELKVDLDRRLADFEANSEAGMPWAEVRRRIGLEKGRANLAQFFLESPLQGSDLDLTRNRLKKPK